MFHMLFEFFFYFVCHLFCPSPSKSAISLHERIDIYIYIYLILFILFSSHRGDQAIECDEQAKKKATTTATKLGHMYNSIQWILTD